MIDRRRPPTNEHCKVCETRLQSQGKYRRGFEYPFLCMQCEQLVMISEKYEDLENKYE